MATQTRNCKTCGASLRVHDRRRRPICSACRRRMARTTGICKCGCGGITRPSRHTGWKPTLYIRWHNLPRHQRQFTQNEQDTFLRLLREHLGVVSDALRAMGKRPHYRDSVYKEAQTNPTFRSAMERAQRLKATTKKCRLCGCVKKRTEFYVTRHSDGTGFHHRPFCIPCYAKDAALRGLPEDVHAMRIALVEYRRKTHYSGRPRFIVADLQATAESGDSARPKTLAPADARRAGSACRIRTPAATF
jgi:hypothetical protein